MSEPAKPTTDLEFFDTADLVNELRRRSGVFFMCMRPMATGDPDHAWSRAWGVDGGSDGNKMPPDAKDRVLGLIHRATFDMLYIPPTLDDLV